MFNLDQAVAEWRRRMLASGIKTPVPLDELESHLREDIEQQIKSGLSVQPAFEAAVQHIGNANMLKNEFEKVAEMKEAREWKQRQTVFVFCGCAISLFIIACLLFRIGSFSELTSIQQISGLAAVALTHLLAWGGQVGYRFFPVILNRQARDAICISGGALMVFWWALFFFVVLPRFDYTISQLDVAIVWGFVTPTGAFAGLVAGVEKGARKDSAAPAS
ncbi:MAG: hypothetical protein QOJ40_1130 [Verrucomicrobiota bacterium]